MKSLFGRDKPELPPEALVLLGVLFLLIALLRRC